MEKEVGVVGRRGRGAYQSRGKRESGWYELMLYNILTHWNVRRGVAVNNRMKKALFYWKCLTSWSLAHVSWNILYKCLILFRNKQELGVSNYEYYTKLK
jgi:hypothetical protein